MSNRHERVWGGNLPPGVFAREDVDASTYIGGLLAEDELDWMTLFNVSTGTTKEISGGNAMDGFFTGIVKLRSVTEFDLGKLIER
ncbi:unnamed protein product [Gongylonema pulchrum]|uniref:Calpain catalytic domain-containing protein n=1 Tax=Gongylonema pulchrum TaxID=637853 RepID=A0A183DEC0_9BILA|nr:unnamed protein product [Gongylonema pulchrum]